MADGIKITVDGPSDALDYMPLRAVLEVLCALQVLLNGMALVVWQKKNCHLFLGSRIRDGDLGFLQP